MIETVKTHEPLKTVSDLGKKQWDCLNALAEHYNEADMGKISKKSCFHDDTWNVHGNNQYNFNWIDWFGGERDTPIKLFLKIVCYHAIQINGLAISTVRKSNAGFIHSFKELLESKSILVASKGQAFNSISLLGSNDITLLAQSTLASSGKLSHSPYDFLDKIVKTPPTVFPNSQFLAANICPPWDEQGMSAQGWIIQLRKAHGIDTTTKSYPPLEFKTVSSLVQNALPFINEHFKTVVSVFDEINNFHIDNPRADNWKLNLQVGLIIEQKYSKKLESILPIKKYDKTSVNSGLITQAWYTQLERLVQGASAWIVLLTTGLRNIDMRNLEKNCCQPSKRHDLLNYLVTDISKTHLVDYVLPVPPQTQKAIQLAELSKIDRSGSMVYTKTNTNSSDEESDNTKIGMGSTFNDMLKYFANHFNIPLETISDDGKEATAHCIRATLAGYIGANSTAAILILKKLFGHSNALMPDAYLSHNPLVIAERNKNILNSQESLADDMANGMVSGRLSGTKGKQMLAGAEHIKKELKAESANKSLTEMDMQIKLKERIKEMLLSRIKENQIYALKTPMSVACIRSCSDSSDTPCAKLPNREQRKKSGVSKEITDTLATLPNPAHCIGKECSDALFGEAWSRDLLGTFDYYIKYLKGIGHQSVDIKNEAELFIKNYGSILKDIYADERGDGYFD